jgi:hypothetical protein
LLLPCSNFGDWDQPLSPNACDTSDNIFITRCDTSLRYFLLRDFLLYIILRTFIPGKKPGLQHNYQKTPVSPWWRAAFGPYHGLWHDDAPTRHANVIPTP